jgi:DNA-binding phage protein
MTDPPNAGHVLQPEKFQNDTASGRAQSGRANFVPNDSRQRAEDYPGFGAVIASDDYLDSRNNLIERLSRSIPDAEYIAQVASEAGLEREHLRLSGTPSNQWSSLIGRAEAEQKERRVAERASRISPDVALRRAIQDYLRHRP